MTACFFLLPHFNALSLDFWIESLPFLQPIPSWILGTYSRRLAEKYLPYARKLRDKPFLDMKIVTVSWSLRACETRDH